MARLMESLLRDIRFLGLPGIPLADRLRLTVAKYSLRARAALRLPPKRAFRFAGRDYFVSAPTDAALLQRVLVDTHECLRIFGLIEKENLTAIDVGAHNGETAIAWSLFLRNPAIHSFEPERVAFENARRNVGEITVEVVPVGLSDRAGDAPFDAHRGSGGDASFAFAGGAHVGTETVRIARGDDLLVGARRVDLVKIDVEGYERHVLDGLHSVLGRCQFLALEMSLVRPKDHRFHEVAGCLAQHRFELLGTGQPHRATASRQTAIDLYFRREPN